MKILNIRQHSTTQYTAKVTTASGQVRPLHVRIDDDGELLFSLSALLRAGGTSPPSPGTDRPSHGMNAPSRTCAPRSRSSAAAGGLLRKAWTW